MDVLIEGECWIWQGRKDRDGYGRLPDSSLAHRAAWSAANGSIPEGAHICHTCDRRDCVRPDHLYAGDHLSNMKDKVDRGRNRNQHMGVEFCKHGHPFDEVNTYTKPNGKRVCRICQKRRKDEWEAHRRGKSGSPLPSGS